MSDQISEKELPAQEWNPGEATAYLREESHQIAEIEDSQGRMDAMGKLVSFVDKQAALDMLRRSGIADTKELSSHVHGFLQQGATEALHHFTNIESSQDSVEARKKVQQGLSDALINYYTRREKIASADLAKGGVAVLVSEIEKKKYEYAQALFDSFQGKPDAWAQFRDTKAVEFFILTIFGAHTRWAVGQVERTRNEMPTGGWTEETPNPLDRPIFGDLRRVRDAVKNDQEAVLMILRDWDEFMVAREEEHNKRD